MIGKSTAEEFAQAVSDLRQSVGVVGSLKEYGIDQKEWEAKLDTLTENAMKDPCTLFNPRKPKFEEIKAILQACYDGTIVNFSLKKINVAKSSLNRGVYTVGNRCK